LSEVAEPASEVAVVDRPRSKNLQVFGDQVRAFRLNAGWSQDQLGNKIHVSGTYIGKVERGEVRCQRKLAQALDAAFELPNALTQLWDNLNLASAFPDWFDWYRVESGARKLRTYQCLVVYGLLQTEDYARALLGGDEEAVSARMERQKILTREDPPPPQVEVLLTEGVLYNPVGGKEVMRGQLERLLAAMADGVRIRVVPGMTPPEGSVGAFVIAQMPNRSELAYVETALRGLSLSEAEDVDTLITAYDAIGAHALPVSMTRDLVVKVLEERWT